MNDAGRAERAVALTTVKTDSEKAKEYKDRMFEALKPVCDILTEAKRDGITVGFQMNIDGMQRTFIGSVTATKEL